METSGLDVLARGRRRRDDLTRRRSKRRGDGDDQTFEGIHGLIARGVVAALHRGARVRHRRRVSSRDVENWGFQFDLGVAGEERSDGVGGAKHEFGGDVHVDFFGRLSKRHVVPIFDQRSKRLTHQFERFGGEFTSIIDRISSALDFGFDDFVREYPSRECRLPALRERSRRRRRASVKESAKR